MLADRERGCLGGLSVVDRGLSGREVLAAISISLFSPAGFRTSWLEVAAKGLDRKESTIRDIFSSGESALLACTNRMILPSECLWCQLGNDAEQKWHRILQ